MLFKQNRNYKLYDGFANFEISFSNQFLPSWFHVNNNFNHKQCPLYVNLQRVLWFDKVFENYKTPVSKNSYHMETSLLIYRWLGGFYMKHVFTDRSFWKDHAWNAEKTFITEFAFSKVEASCL